MSADRLAPYLRAGGGDVELAMELYVWNGRVSASLLRDLGDLEVLVRNAYDHAISTRWTGEWLVADRFPSFAPMLRGGRDTNAVTREMAQRALREAGGQGAPRGKVIANLSFGFWRSLSDRRHEHDVWTPYVRHAFQPGLARREVDSRMEGLRQLRNRIAHHESVLARDLIRDVEQLLQLARWISPEVADFMQARSTTAALIHGRPT